MSGTKEAGDTTAVLKVAFGNHDVLPAVFETIESEFFNDVATFNLSRLIYSEMANGNVTIASGIYLNGRLKMHYSVFKSDGTLIYKGLALNAVSQLGMPTDMVSYLGYFLTGFDEIKTFAGYERIIYAVAFENSTTYLFVDGSAAASTTEKHFGLNVGTSIGEIALANSNVDKYLRDNNGAIITDQFGEPITILDDEGGIHRRMNVSRGCIARNPFYVRWINRLGGIDYWLFGKSQEFEKSIENTSIYDLYVLNTSTATENQIQIDLEASENVVVGAENLTRNEYEELSRILYSPYVEWYDESKAKWMRIIPDKGDTKNDTAGYRKSIEIKFILPKPYVQF
ncbi:MAG: hypothetical protein ACK5KP_11095 [Paludibacteraceae bacterium]